MTQHYLSVSEVAKRLGLTTGTIKSYYHDGRLPPPDATIGKTNGWKPETIDQWNQNRPGRGHRTDLDQHARLNQQK